MVLIGVSRRTTSGRGEWNLSEQQHNGAQSPATEAALAAARKLCRHYRHAYITPEHILLGLLEAGGPDAMRIVKRSKATPAQMKKLVEHHLRAGDNDVLEERLNFSERAKRVLEAARVESVKQQAEQIEPRHVLHGLGKVPNTVAAAVLGAVDLKGDDIFS